ncbi:hypothetical protein T492DRAFT_530721 [Pavlovales sp. CCMP2436]|nr:hypothetical protein T492DRAFT_530721 [Pavlovales sp. CCMP2436]
MRGRSEGRSEEPGASPTAILQFAYIFWGLSCMVAGTVLPTLLRSYGGPATSCVAIFCNAQQASTLGWLAQTQTLKVADVYLPGSSGLVRVKHVLSLLEYVGVCGSAGAWLRLWLTLKHAALDSPPSVSLSESSASLRLCVRVFCVCLVLYVTLGVEVPTGNYMLVCLAVYLPAGLLSLGATFVFWRDHGFFVCVCVCVCVCGGGGGGRVGGREGVGEGRRG